MTERSDFYIRKNYLEQTHSALSDKSLQSIADTKAEHTIDAYESDWNDFCDWCAFHHEKPLPAPPETIINYINDLADYATVATIRRRVSAISENYHAAGLSAENPCKDWMVREALIGLSRQKGVAQKGKTPIYWEEIEKMVSLMDSTKLTDVRDKAILLLGFMGAFRRSEIAELDVEDLRFFSQGMVVTITHSKTDQTSAGQQVGIPYIEDTNLCAVTAVRNWLRRADLHSGALFRRILKSGQPGSGHISDKSINLIIKKYVSLIGLDPELYGAHSLRHGFATSAALSGLEERIIMKQTRHRSVEMVRRYINEGDLFVNNPVAMMFSRRKNTRS